MTLANKLTFFRLALVPVFMAALAFPHVWSRVLAFFLFIGASLTDFYDGQLARRTGTVTRIGTYLDPLADKLLIAAALIGFVEIHELRIPAWMVVVIIGREFLITGLRSLAASRGIVISADKAGKWKTVAQMTAVIAILMVLIVNSTAWLPHTTAWPPVLVDGLILFLLHGPYLLVALAMVITLWSGALYIRKYRRLLRDELSMHKTPTRKR